MFKIKDYVIYGRRVCIIKNIKVGYLNNEDYYILNPTEDISLTISVPVIEKSNEIRPIITKPELEDLINRIPEISIIDSPNEKVINNEYKNLIKTNSHEDLIKIIKTAYLRKEAKKNIGKKAGASDESYLRMAEKLLYSEISVVLNLSYDDTKKYIYDKVEELDKKTEGKEC